MRGQDCKHLEGQGVAGIDAGQVFERFIKNIIHRFNILFLFDIHRQNDYYIIDNLQQRAIIMNSVEKQILHQFKTSVLKKVPLYKLILFGSRARGDAEPYSDVDVVVIVDDQEKKKHQEYISDCAWEAGFAKGVVLVPVVYTKREWLESPERSSLLALAVEKEGIAL